MNKRDILYLLYKFSAGQKQEFGQLDATYKIVYLFNHNGPLETSELSKVRREDRGEGERLEFHSKEHLMTFSQSVMEQNNYSAVNLLTATDYNIGIESCHDLESLRDIFNKYGTNIENSRPSGGSILGRFF